MEIVRSVLIGFIAFLHLYFLWLEMFAWTTRGRKVFKKFSAEMFVPTKVLAANQGLYNGFLAAGLIWTFFIQNPLWKMNISFFFLACISMAGIFGGLSVDKKIFFIQALPALLAIVLILL